MCLLIGTTLPTDEALPLGDHYEGKIDLLIADVVLSGMDGVEFAESIRNVRPDMAVLIVSGYGDGVIINGYVKKSGTKMLSKPFDDMTLARTI